MLVVYSFFMEVCTKDHTKYSGWFLQKCEIVEDQKWMRLYPDVMRSNTTSVCQVEPVSNERYRISAKKVYDTRQSNDGSLSLKNYLAEVESFLRLLSYNRRTPEAGAFWKELFQRDPLRLGEECFWPLRRLFDEYLRQHYQSNTLGDVCRRSALSLRTFLVFHLRHLTVRLNATPWLSKVEI